MADPVRISFVVPAYNEEALLPACLQAIQAEVERSGANAEIVVVDNASTDRTAQVARAFPGVAVVHEPRKGLVQARKAGFEASSGVLVANIDADTLLPPPAGSTGSRPSSPATRRSSPSAGRTTTTMCRAGSGWRRGPFYMVGFGTYCFNRYVLRVGSMVQGGNFVLKRDALIRAGGFDPSFTFYGEDTDIARRMAGVGKVKFTWSLMAQSSGRRLQGDGLFMTGLRYSTNYLWATYFRKPFTTALAGLPLGAHRRPVSTFLPTPLHPVRNGSETAMSDASLAPPPNGLALAGWGHGEPAAVAAADHAARHWSWSEMGRLRPGTAAHARAAWAMFRDTFNPYKPTIIDWPKLDDEARARLINLPIWDIAVQTEGKARMRMLSYARTLTNPPWHDAVELNGWEEGRHKVVLSNLVQAYGIALEPEPPYLEPRDPEWAYMVTGFSECIDSFFAFGLFAMAKRSGFFPAELVETFEPVMQEECRHILLFANWLAAHRATPFAAAPDLVRASGRGGLGVSRMGAGRDRPRHGRRRQGEGAGQQFYRHRVEIGFRRTDQRRGADGFVFVRKRPPVRRL